MSHTIQSYIHEDTSTFTHLLVDDGSLSCAIVDPVLDYDPKSGKTDTGFIDRILDDIASRGLNLKLVLETHAHADHLTSAAYIREKNRGEYCYWTEDQRYSEDLCLDF